MPDDDNTPIILVTHDLLAGMEITLGRETYVIACDVPAGTILYTLDGALRPWPSASTDPATTNAAGRRTRPSRGSSAGSPRGTRMGRREAPTSPPDSGGTAVP